MVSLWPFKGEDSSPAFFEKTLSTLSDKITRATSRLDLHRQHARRFKALWTLYTTFVYLLYSIILALVLGWQNWGLKEYAAIVGGPVVIYIVRAGAAKYYEYRISNTQRYLENLNTQRDETIEKLKVATKYNSTQQLLEKYAGDPPKQRAKSGEQKLKAEGKRKPSQPQQPPVQRTGIPPPPTANIRRPAPPQSPPSQPPSPYPPQQQQSPQFPPNVNAPLPPLPSGPPGLDEPGFAPNAFPAPQQYIEHSRWYDRLLDVLLGEDETQPKNRIVLICGKCRLVNGQAPPGVKSLEELGRWRCGGCGAWNGEESATKKVLADIKAEAGPAAVESDPEADAEHRSSASTDDGVIVARDEDGDEDEDGELEHEQENIDSQSSSGAETPSEEAEAEAEVEPQDAPRTRSQARRRGRKG